MKRLELCTTVMSTVWWLVGFYWIVMGRQELLQDCLYWLSVVYLAFDLFFMIFCIGMACIMLVAVFCCFPIFDEGVRTSKRKQLEDKLLQVPRGVLSLFSLFSLEHPCGHWSTESIMSFVDHQKSKAVTILWFGISSFYNSHRESILGTLGRVVMITLLFLVLVLNSSYTANLTSSLTVQELYSPIEGIESLKHGNERIGYQVGSFVEDYLIEIGIEKSRLVALNSPEEYARELLLGPKKGGVVAVVDELPYIQVFLSTHCKFEIVGQQFTKSGWGFAFPQHSLLTDAFTTALLSLSENGDIQRIHDKWLTTPSCSTASTELDSDILPLKSYAGLFLVCGIAIAAAVLLYYLRISLISLGEGGNVVQQPEPDPDQTCENSGNKCLRKLICQSGEKNEDENNESSSRDTKRRKMSLPR